MTVALTSTIGLPGPSTTTSQAVTIPAIAANEAAIVICTASAGSGTRSISDNLSSPGWISAYTDNTCNVFINYGPSVGAVTLTLGSSVSTFLTVGVEKLTGLKAGGQIFTVARNLLTGTYVSSLPLTVTTQVHLLGISYQFATGGTLADNTSDWTPYSGTGITGNGNVQNTFEGDVLHLQTSYRPPGTWTSNHVWQADVACYTVVVGFEAAEFYATGTNPPGPQSSHAVGQPTGAGPTLSAIRAAIAYAYRVADIFVYNAGGHTGSGSTSTSETSNTFTTQAGDFIALTAGGDNVASTAWTVTHNDGGANSPLLSTARNTSTDSVQMWYKRVQVGRVSDTVTFTHGTDITFAGVIGAVYRPLAGYALGFESYTYTLNPSSTTVTSTAINTVGPGVLHGMARSHSTGAWTIPKPYGWASVGNLGADAGTPATPYGIPVERYAWSALTSEAPTFATTAAASDMQLTMMAIKAYKVLGRVKYWNGSTWVIKPLKVWNGSGWIVPQIKRWNGSAWVV